MHFMLTRSARVPIIPHTCKDLVLCIFLKFKPSSKWCIHNSSMSNEVKQVYVFIGHFSILFCTVPVHAMVNAEILPFSAPSTPSTLPHTQLLDELINTYKTIRIQQS